MQPAAVAQALPDVGVPQYVLVIVVLALALILGWKLLKLAFRVALISGILLLGWLALSKAGFLPGPT
ncbi:MAG TPA: hypothetical protein VM889_06980 [Candidatus Thermoplasmatota archaeon]|nr:hypothetical protein [Candidatus Thermoplasmatota archaeon]